MATTVRRMEEPIKVFFRVRPFNAFEEKSGCNTAVNFIDRTRVSIKDHSVGDFQVELDSVSDSFMLKAALKLVDKASYIDFYCTPTERYFTSTATRKTFTGEYALTCRNNF